MIAIMVWGINAKAIDNPPIMEMGAIPTGPIPIEGDIQPHRAMHITANPQKVRI